MRISRTHEVDAPLDACWAMVHDPDSHVAKFTAMGHRDLQVVECDRTEDHLHLVIDRVVDVEVPSFARRVLQPTNSVRSTDDWSRAQDGTCHGTFTLATRGVPIDIAGTTSLVDGDAGTRYTIEVEVSVRVPVIGRRVAEVARGIVEQQLDDEFRLCDQWVATH